MFAITDLKPCPFCGSGDTRIIEDNTVGLVVAGSGAINVHHFCRCNNCDCKLNEYPPEAQSIDQAIKIWNIRADQRTHITSEDDLPSVGKDVLFWTKTGKRRLGYYHRDQFHTAGFDKDPIGWQNVSSWIYIDDITGVDSVGVG